MNFVYDPVGNRMIRTQPDVTYTYNLQNNRLTSSSDGWNYNYDNNGNLTSKASLLQSINFSYDFENRNTKVRLLPQPDSLVFSYSGFGSRIQKIEKSGSVVDTTLYVYDGIYAVCEFSGSDVLKANYVYANGLLLAQTTPTLIPEQRSYYHHDGLGSIVGITNATSAVTQTYLYDDFGVLVDSAGTAINAYRYTGQEWDGGVSSLYNYRARYYDATIGRFNQEDPWEGDFENPQTLDRYIYVSNDPINFIDPEGLAPCPLPPLGNPTMPKPDPITHYGRIAYEYSRWPRARIPELPTCDPCNPCEKNEVEKRLKDIKDVQSGGSTGLSAAESIPTRNTLYYPEFYKQSPCVQRCIVVHEAAHRTPFGIGIFEKYAYWREKQCLKGLLK